MSPDFVSHSRCKARSRRCVVSLTGIGLGSGFFFTSLYSSPRICFVCKAISGAGASGAGSSRCRSRSLPHPLLHCPGRSLGAAARPHPLRPHPPERSPPCRTPPNPRVVLAAPPGFRTPRGSPAPLLCALLRVGALLALLRKPGLLLRPRFLSLRGEMLPAGTRGTVLPHPVATADAPPAPTPRCFRRPPGTAVGSGPVVLPPPDGRGPPTSGSRFPQRGDLGLVRGMSS